MNEANPDDGIAESIYGRLYQVVLSAVRRWVRCSHLAEDVACEAVARAWRCLRLTLSWERLLGWTVRVAQRLVIDWHRAVMGHRHSATVEVDDIPAPDEVFKVDFDDGAAHALSMLAPGLRGTLRLLVAGATTEEIAQAHGLSDRGARKQLARLRSELLVLWN